MIVFFLISKIVLFSSHKTEQNVLLMIFYYPCLKLFSISKLAYLPFEEHKNMSEIVNGADKDIKRKSYTDPNRDFISQF